MPLSGASETLVRRWLDRAENRSEWERLRVTLSLAEGFQFFALQVGDPITEHFLEMLLKGEAGDNGVGLAGFDLSRPPEEGPIVSLLLRALEAAPRPSWFFLRGGSVFRGDQAALGELFLYVNQKRDVIAQTAGGPFLLSLSPEGWLLFRQTAPDFWSIHTSVYRFSGAEVRREERLREASEEAFVWQTFAEFVALRLLRSALPPRSLRKQVWPPPARDGLIGRDSERKTLRTWLAQPGARILVQGSAGTGKTSLLRAVMEEMPSSYPDGIFFFSFRVGEEVPRIMEEVVESLRPGLLPTLLRRSVLEAMYQDVTAEKKILLVLDDAHLGALERLAPSPPSAVLAGQAAPAPDGWRVLSLDLLGTRESIELLQRISPGLPRETARSLAHEARGYPLLLQLLGGVARASPQSLDRWTESSRTRVFSWDPLAGPGTIQAAAFELPPELKEAWRGAAVFQASFEMERFQAVAGLASVELARERLETLVSRRLLDHSKEGLWSMHPLLRHAALRIQLLGGEPTEALRRKHGAYHLRRLAGKSEEWKDFLPDVEEALRWWSSSGRSDLGELWGFIDHMGMAPPQDCLRYLAGRWASVWLDAVAQSAAEGGDLDLAVAARRWSALACVREEDVNGARERFAGAKTLAREGRRPDLEAAVLCDQAAFAFWTDHTEEISGLAQEILRLGSDERARGILSILAMLTALSRGEDLEGFPVKELASLVEGAEFSLSPALLRLLGTMLAARSAEASELATLHKQLEMVLDPAADPARDPGVRTWALALKAELYLRQENQPAAYDSAESAVRQAHDAYDREAESEALRVLGRIQEALGDLARAESSYRRLLELREQLYSPDHEGVAWAARDLVRVLATMNRFAEAESFSRRAAGILQRGRPGADRALATSLSEWGTLLVTLKRTSEAETVLREALAASLSALGPTHLRSVHIMGLLAYVILTAGRLDEAEDLLRSAVAIQDRSNSLGTSAGRQSLGQNLSLLARVLAQRGQTRDALAILQDRQLPIFEELGDARDRALTLHQIAELLAVEQRYDEALPLLEKGLELFNELGDIRGRAATLGGIARLCAAQERYGEALPFLREQLSLLEKLGDRQAVEEARKTLQAYEAEARR